MIKNVTFFFALLFAGMSVSSCISDKNIVYLQGVEGTYAVPRDIQQAFELKIQSDDQLAISVASKNKELIEPFNNNTLIGGGSNGNYNNTTNVASGVSYFQVDKNGNIEFPIFGTMHVGGKTCVELSKEIQARLISGNYIRDAVVNTKIMSFKVTVLGDVKNPGVQNFEGERLTVLEALGKAGDLNNSAKRENVLVVREENGKRVTYPIDLRDTRSVFDSPGYYLQQNDVVYVQPNKSVRVKGSTSYTLLSVSSTLVSMVVSVVSLIISLNK
ncbi:polysaccharide biosynthesis/export family protein [Bacteroides acidifaciens]|uniref:polysaccharide biosynthesis/export family protein n=1 Tax=Bacteroides acidifaciens TaxID=85831 RepID=UPI0025828F80|nr:polysaccharide biosynthesis/export family protein [Bacteroides acidifaciens]